MSTTHESSLRPILIADDEADDEFLIRHRLVKSGTPHPILAFADGADLIEYLETVRTRGHIGPRLLFLDLKMPKVDGYDALRWIRSQQDLGGLTVVVVTSSERQEDKERARACGAQQVLTKFPSAEELGEAVSRFA